MKTTNLNNFAKNIALQEGLKKSVNIGQIKEILSITMKLLRKLSMEEVIELLKRTK